MLVVVLGAGASFDSDAAVRVCSGPWCPPLTNRLFDAEEFGEALRRFPECAPIVPRLRGLPDGVSLEERLDELQAEGESGYGRRKVQLAAVQLYLRYVLYRVSMQSRERTSYVTNYAVLLDKLNRWHLDTREPVTVVTFNYDTLLEDACLSALGRRIRTIFDYTEDEGFRILKPHGSWNWGRLLDTKLFPDAPPDEAIIESAAELPVRDEYAIVHPQADGSPSNAYVDRDGKRRAGVPLIALPMKSKAAFACPPWHRDRLKDAIWSMTKLITIGWRAQEPHVLALIAEGRKGVSVRRLLVTATETGAIAVGKKLEATGITGGGHSFYQDRAFSGLVTGNLLDEFLVGRI